MKLFLDGRLAEQNRYFLSPPSTNPITSMRVLLGETKSAPVVHGRYNGFSNPSDAIKAILENAVWGLGKSVNASTFATAKTQLTTLGLTVGGCLAGDRQQRQARIVVNEMLRVARGRMWKTSGQWEIAVDAAAPSAPSVTLRFANGGSDNVKRIETDTRTPLSQVPSTVSLAYLRGARSRTNTRLMPTDYGKIISKAALGIGKPVTITAPWVRDYTTASKMLHYETERAIAADRKITLTAGLDGRQLRVGQNVYLIAPTQGLSTATEFTVGRVEKRLGDVRLRLDGYSANIYSAVSGVSTEPDDVDSDDARTVPGTGVNLVPNSDFSTRLKREGAPALDLDSQILPGWRLESNNAIGAKITALTYTLDPLAIGGGYITFTAVGTNANLEAGQVGLVVADKCRPIGEKRRYVFSYYAPAGTRCAVTWYDDQSGGVRIDNCAIRVDSGDINGKGWPRHYSVFRAPPNSDVLTPGVRVAYAEPRIMPIAAGTYSVDAVQFELATRIMHRPSHFKRHTPVGWDPGRGAPGALTIQPATGSGESGTEVDHLQYSATLTNGASSIEVGGSGANVLPANCDIFGVVVHIDTAVTFGGGGTKFRIGTAIDPDAWGEIPNAVTTTLTAGTKTGNGDKTISGYPAFSTATALLITTDSGTFAGGVLHVTFGWLKLKPRQA